MKYKKIAVLNTRYSMLIYLLLNREKVSQTYFIFNDDMNLKKIHKIVIKEKKSSNVFKSFIYQIYFLLKIKNICSKNKLHNKIVYGQDHIQGAQYFRKFYKFYLLEDGVANYEDNLKKEKNKVNNIQKNFLRKLVRKILLKDFDYGLSPNIQKIYLTGLASVPEEIAPKVEIINLKELWNKKTLEEQNEILDIFSFDLNIKEKIKGRDIILFTQPLSEDNIITEEEKLKIYSEIIKKYQKERLVIKTHPREKTNYKEIFKEYLILDNPFPFEILNLLDIKFNKAITLFSTAALALGAEVEVDFYGTEVHPKILEKVGSCNKIMKRNCFLKEE